MTLIIASVLSENVSSCGYPTTFWSCSSGSSERNFASFDDNYIEACKGCLACDYRFVLLSESLNYVRPFNLHSLERDLPFVMRVIGQCTAPDSPSDLGTEATELGNKIKNKFNDTAAEAFSLVETCPACQAHIPFENMLTAICPSGHTWRESTSIISGGYQSYTLSAIARCSITSFLLSTPLVRTCISCTRKAFLAPSSVTSGTEAANSLPMWTNMPEAARTWFVEELLEAARYCLFCGSRFVRIL